MWSTWQITFCATLVVIQASTSLAVSPVYSYESSCKRIKTLDPTATSRQYVITTSTGSPIEVYCEMGLNGGGYTFIYPADLKSLTDAEIQAMFTDRSSFLLRVRRSDGTQPYAVLRQLPQYQNYQLKLGLNNHYGYANTMNLNHFRDSYLYYGFLPITVARGRTVQGIRVNGKDVTFTNCDGHPNSYFALFANYGERNPTTNAFKNNFPVCATLFSALKSTPSTRAMPVDFFTFMESHWGGCGCFTQTDGRQSIAGIVSGAIGFR